MIVTRKGPSPQVLTRMVQYRMKSEPDEHILIVGYFFLLFPIAAALVYLRVTSYYFPHGDFKVTAVAILIFFSLMWGLPALELIRKGKLE